MAKYVQYFVLDPERFQAKCKLCVEHTIIKYSKSSKTNLATHVELTHRHATAKQKAAAVGVSTIVMALKGPPLFSNQKSITEAVVDMIIDQNMPLKIVEQPSFRHVLAVASSIKSVPVQAYT